MGLRVPGGGDSADEFIPPGGITLPEHLTPDNLSLLGHLFGNALTPLHTAAQILERGGDIGVELGNAVRSARKEITRTVDFLLERYGSDIDAISGLRQFLIQFRQDVKDFRWQQAVDDYRAASARFHFSC
ncbi:hypothetical protein HYW83_00340 [Candidatus Peregrinibacteria bacterium]|nr:hypothetical protein [Candidatus Peregrinibacteria bacterium]